MKKNEKSKNFKEYKWITIKQKSKKNYRIV